MTRTRVRRLPHRINRVRARLPRQMKSKDKATQTTSTSNDNGKRPKNKRKSRVRIKQAEPKCRPTSGTVGQARKKKLAGKLPKVRKITRKSRRVAIDDRPLPAARPFKEQQLEQFKDNYYVYQESSSKKRTPTSEIEVFVVTNGSSCLQYCLKCLDAQSIRRKVTVVHDLSLIDAVRVCSALATQLFFVLVNDDMWLDAYTVEFFEKWTKKLIKKQEARRTAMVTLRLWEVWSDRVIDCVKAYNNTVVKKVRFRPNVYGRIDANFEKDIGKKRYRLTRDKRSIGGLHVLRPLEDQEAYIARWRKSSRKGKSYRKLIKRSTTLEEQFSRMGDLAKRNTKRKTPLGLLIERESP